LRAAGISVWKNPNSNTVFFERPSKEILEEYDLAVDESTRLGKLAHFLVMPHVKRPLVERFVADMRRWKQGQ
jgi:histidine decarboxylase